MSESIVLVLLDVSIRGSLLIVAAWIATRVMSRRSAAERHMVWLLAVVGLLAIPLFTAVAPRIPLPLAATSPVETAQESGAEPGFGAGADPDAAGSGQVEFTSWRPDVGERGSRVPQWLTGIPADRIVVAVWLLVAAGISLGFLSARWRVRRHLRTLPRFAAAQVHSRIESLRRTQRIGRGITVLCSETDRSPWTWGVIHPRLVLPADFPDWPPAAQQQALLHEFAHIRRNDHLIALLVQACCAVYWFNPLTWLAARRIRLESEQACDDRVLESGASASDYAEQLLKIANSVLNEKRHSVWIPAMAHRSSLSPRVRSILDPDKGRSAMNRFKSVTFAAMMLVIAAPLAVLDSRQSIAQENVAQENIARLSVDDPVFQQLVARGPEGSVELERIVETYVAGDMPAAAADAMARFMLKEYGTPDDRGCDYCIQILSSEGTPRQHKRFSTMVAALDLIERRAEESGAGDMLLQAVLDNVVGSGNRRAMGRASYYVMRSIQIGIDESRNLAIADFLYEQGNPEQALTLARRLFEDSASSHYQTRDAAEWIRFLESEVKRREELSRMIVDSLGYSDVEIEGDYLPIFKTPPVYPAAAAQARIEGYVVVEFTVDAEGKPADVVVVESSDAVFNESALAAANGFRYKPRVVAGSAVAVPGVRNKIAYRLE